MELSKDAGWDAHINAPKNSIIIVAKRVMWLRLPPSVRQYCQLQKCSHYKNVKELVISINRYPGTPPDLDKLVDDGKGRLKTKTPSHQLGKRIQFKKARFR